MWIITGIISMVAVISALLLATNKKIYMSMVSIAFLGINFTTRI